MASGKLAVVVDSDHELLSQENAVTYSETRPQCQGNNIDDEDTHQPPPGKPHHRNQQPQQQRTSSGSTLTETNVVTHATATTDNNGQGGDDDNDDDDRFTKDDAMNDCFSIYRHLYETLDLVIIAGYLTPRAKHCYRYFLLASYDPHTSLYESVGVLSSDSMDRYDRVELSRTCNLYRIPYPSHTYHVYRQQPEPFPRHPLSKRRNLIDSNSSKRVTSATEKHEQRELPESIQWFLPQVLVEVTFETLLPVELFTSVNFSACNRVRFLASSFAARTMMSNWQLRKRLYWRWWKRLHAIDGYAWFLRCMLNVRDQYLPNSLGLVVCLPRFVRIRFDKFDGTSIDELINMCFEIWAPPEEPPRISLSSMQPLSFGQTTTVAPSSPSPSLQILHAIENELQSQQQLQQKNDKSSSSFSSTLYAKLMFCILLNVTSIKSVPMTDSSSSSSSDDHEVPKSNSIENSGGVVKTDCGDSGQGYYEEHPPSSNQPTLLTTRRGMELNLRLLQHEQETPTKRLIDLTRMKTRYVSASSNAGTRWMMAFTKQDPVVVPVDNHHGSSDDDAS